MAVQCFRLVFVSWVDIFYRQWDVITRVLDRNHIYFNSPNNINFKQTKVNFGSKYFVIPSLIVLAYGVRAFVCLISFWRFPQWTETTTQRFWLGTEVFPEQGRPNMEMAFFLWCSMYLLIVVLYATKTIVDFKFFSLLVVNRDTGINPRHMQLDEQKFFKLARYRARCIWLIRLIIASLSYGAMVALTALSLMGTVFQVTVMGTTFWILVLGIWIACVSCVVYGIPILISIVVYYFILKQRDLEQKINELLIMKKISNAKSIHRGNWATFFKFLQINRAYAKLASELDDYNRIWQYYLTILINFYSLLIVYMTYLIFLNNLGGLVVSVYTLCYLAHIVTLTLLLRCAMVSGKDRQISKKVDQFHVHSFRSTNVLPRQIIKVGNCDFSI